MVLWRGGGTPKSLEILNAWQCDKLNLIVPDLIFYELTNALVLGKGMPRLRVSGILEKFYESRPQIIAVGPDILELALDYVFGFGITIYDAVFVAVAETFDTLLITEGRKHHRQEVSPKITYLEDFKL